MRLGISTACYFPRLMTEECFSEIKKAGAECAEVFLEGYVEYEDSFDSIIKPLQTVPVHSVHALPTQFEPELISKNSRALQGAVFWFKKVLQRAKNLGASCYTYHGALKLTKKKYTFDYNFLAERMRAACGIAAEYGITLTYENAHYAFGGEPEYFKNLLPLVPDLGACLDLKHAMKAGCSWKDFFNVMKGRLRTIHVCDYDENGDMRLPGRGIFDFKEFFNVLKGEGVTAPLILEVYDSSYKDFNEVKDSFIWLQNAAK